MSENIYSKQRKELQSQGLLPEWMSTAGWQMYSQKYLYKASNLKEQYERIASTLARHIEGYYPSWWEDEYGSKTWKDVFFEELWSGNLSPSTPIHCNTGTDRGLVVSCSGSMVDDSVESFYSTLKEVALLSKEGFGTSVYLGKIRPRGASISGGGKASGVLPVLKLFVQCSRDISQGSQRRGAVACSLPIEHGDFEEVRQFVETEPDDVNIAWLIGDEFVARLKQGDTEARSRIKRALKTKMITGRGYFTFPDKINRHAPQMYKDLGLEILFSQLCQEISLFCDEDHTFTCVLSSTNLANYRTLGKYSIFVHLVFLDCVVSEFLEKAKSKKGLERAVLFTEKSRACGLGVMGLHTLFQQEMIPFASFDAHMLNNQIFKRLKDETLEASQWLASVLGEPEWCKGYGMRNTHRTAVAPTKSSALIMGGQSEGINPDPAMTYTQTTAAGEVDRVNPVLLKIMKEKGIYDDKHIQEIVVANGSVQSVDWLSEEEKKVFLTAFEIDPNAILRLASARQKHLCQMQSLNLFFSSEEEESFIGGIHKNAFEDEYIHSLYYAYGMRGVAAAKKDVVCEACQ